MMQIVMVRTDTAQCSPAPPGPRATETEADHEDEQEDQRRHLEPVRRAAASGLDTEQERLIWGDFVRHIFVSFDAQKREGPIQ